MNLKNTVSLFCLLFYDRKLLLCFAREKKCMKKKREEGI